MMYGNALAAPLDADVDDKHRYFTLKKVFTLVSILNAFVSLHSYIATYLTAFIINNHISVKNMYTIGSET